MGLTRSCSALLCRVGVEPQLVAGAVAEPRQGVAKGGGAGVGTRPPRPSIGDVLGITVPSVQPGCVLRPSKTRARCFRKSRLLG